MAHARFKCLRPHGLQKGVCSQQESKATTRKASDSVMWNKTTKFTSLSSICLMQSLHAITNKIKPARRSPSAGHRTGLFWGTHLLNQSRWLIVSCRLFDHSSPRLGGPCGSLRHHGPLWGCKIKSALVPPSTSFFLPWRAYSPSKHACACKIPSFLTPCDIITLGFFGTYWHQSSPFSLLEKIVLPVAPWKVGATGWLTVWSQHLWNKGQNTRISYTDFKQQPSLIFPRVSNGLDNILTIFSTCTARTERFLGFVHNGSNKVWHYCLLALSSSNRIIFLPIVVCIEKFFEPLNKLKVVLKFSFH